MDLDASVFTRLDKITKTINSREPEDIADYLGIHVIDAVGSLKGMITCVLRMTFIAVSPNMDDVMHKIALSHELGHDVCGHLKEPGFFANDGTHSDYELMKVPLYAATISRHEKEANIVAADLNVDTPALLEMIGYGSSAVAEYRELRTKLRKLQNDYESTLFSVRGRNPSYSLRCHLVETRRLFQKTSNELHAIEQELQQMDCCLSFDEMAAILNVPRVILEYKFEALRIRGYDIDPVELASFDKVFKK